MPTNSRERGPGFHQLAGDCNGAVVIIGIVVAAMLVGSIYHMAGIADAIVWREDIQNAADAAAFSNAIYHAQGMHVLVGLNIAMAVAMAVLVTWRILELLAAFLLAAVSIACFATGFGCGAMPNVLQWNARLIRQDPKISRNVMKICSGLNVLEKLAATAAPPIATGVSIHHTNRDYDPNWVITLSPSIALPPFEEIGAHGLKEALSDRSLTKKITECFQRRREPTPTPRTRRAGSPPPPANNHHSGGHSDGKTWEEVSQRRMGIIFSLPAQEDHLGKLCMKAGNLLDPIFLKWTKGTPVGGLLELVSGAKAQLFGSVPSLFCAPATSGHRDLGNSVQDMIKKQVKERCDKEKDRFLALPIPERKKHPFYSPGGPRGGGRNPGWGSFDTFKCETESQNEAKKHYKDRTEAREALDQVLECVKPARVWEPSRNGNIFMQSFAWVNRDEYPEAPKPRQTPSIGPANPEPVMGPPANTAPPPAATAAPDPATLGPPQARTVRAQAEMYFDCEGTWKDNCDPDAMWKFKWKARLRPVQPLKQMLEEAMGSALAAGFAIGSQELLMEKVFHSGSVLGTDVKYGTSTNHVFYRIQEELRKAFLHDDNADKIIH